MFKSNKGITLVALIITIIIMIILVTVGINLGTSAINKANLEDIKTNMLSIKTKAKTIEDKYSFGDIPDLIGDLLEPEDIARLNSNLQTELDGKTAYKWTQEVLNEQGLTDINVDNEKFYIVCYSEGVNPCEVYYSIGYTNEGETLYSLTDLQNLED